MLRGLNLEWGSTPTGGQGYWDSSTYDPQLDDQTPLIELMARSKPTPSGGGREARRKVTRSILLESDGYPE